MCGVPSLLLFSAHRCLLNRAEHVIHNRESFSVSPFEAVWNASLLGGEKTKAFQFLLKLTRVMSWHIFIRANKWNALKSQCCVRNLNEQCCSSRKWTHFWSEFPLLNIQSPVQERPTEMFPLCVYRNRYSQMLENKPVCFIHGTQQCSEFHDGSGCNFGFFPQVIRRF